MSRDNVEILKRTVEAWNRDDFAAWIDLFDPEFEWSALMEVFRGHQGAQQAWQSFKEHGELKVRFDDVRDLGDSVLALGELKAIGRTTRLDTSSEIAQLAAFRDGKIISFRDFPSRAEGLKAAGLLQ
jgi:ketosteroid isomerase-like protein